jgi:hypothetical protein
MVRARSPGTPAVFSARALPPDPTKSWTPKTNQQTKKTRERIYRPTREKIPG